MLHHDRSPSNTSSHIVVGKFGRPHGVKGYLRVFSYTDPYANLADYQPWWIQRSGQWSSLTWQHIHSKSHPLLVQPSDCTNRHQARNYTHLLVYISRDTLPPLKEGNYYLQDLIGVPVINQQQLLLGQVHKISFTKAHPILHIHSPSGHHLIPHVPAIVLNFSLEEPCLHVDWEGSPFA